MPEAVVKNSDGIYGLNYNAITSLLVEGIKQQESEIELLKAEIAELKNKSIQPKDNVKMSINSINVIPNPITGVSVVSYRLEKSNSQAMLVIYDLQGKILKQIALAENVKEGQVQVSKSQLGAGVYVFALVAGNTEIQSKKVLVAE